MLKAHRELEAALSGGDAHTGNIDTLLDQLNNEVPTKRKEFVARFDRKYILDARPE